MGNTENAGNQQFQAVCSSKNDCLPSLSALIQPKSFTILTCDINLVFTAPFQSSFLKFNQKAWYQDNKYSTLDSHWEIIDIFLILGMHFHMYLISNNSCRYCSQTSPGFYVSVLQVFWKHWRNFSFSPFPTMFSIRLKNFLPSSSNLKLPPANSFSLE